MGTVRAFPTFYSPTGFQKLVVSSTAIGFTIPTTVQCRAVIFSVETDQIRFKVDGNAATSTDGILLEAGDVVELTNVTMIDNFLAIRITNDATLQIHYFGGGA